MGHTVPQVSLLRNPILYFRNWAREKQIQEFRERSVSQEEYFAKQLRWLYSAGDQLLFKGYDAPFMEQGSTIDALRKATGNPSGAVYVCAILTEGLDTVLDELAKTSDFIKVIKTPEKLVKGYTIFDNWGLSLWDSTKSTYYPPEEDKGVFYRAMTYDPRRVIVYKHNFRKAEMELRARG